MVKAAGDAGAAADPGGGRDDGDAEQPGQAGGGVVHARCHPGPAAVDRTEHGGGERRHRRRHPEAEQDHRRQDGADVVVARPDPGEQQQPARRQQRPDGHRDPRPDACGQLSGARRQAQKYQREGEERHARRQRRVVEHLLQLQDAEERDRAEGCIDGEGRFVGAGEGSRTEDRERQEGIAVAALVDQEPDEQEPASPDDRERGRRRPAPSRTLDERVGHPAEAEHGQRRALDVEWAVLA